MAFTVRSRRSASNRHSVVNFTSQCLPATTPHHNPRTPTMRCVYHQAVYSMMQLRGGGGSTVMVGVDSERCDLVRFVVDHGGDGAVNETGRDHLEDERQTQLV
jgi:hypothetical protein